MTVERGLRGKGEGLYLNSQSALIQFVNSQPTPVLMKSPPSRGLYIYSILCLHYLNGIRLIWTRSFAVKFH